MANSERPLPLAGVKVVELGTYVAAPLVSRVLADCGADVVKVEGPKGDDWRIMGKAHFGMPVSDEENVLFTMMNTNKRFLAANLKTEEGLEILKKLIAQADVFVVSIRMKSLQKMGLDYESLKKDCPGLVYAHMTGFGYEGPDAERPGFDMAAFSARTGALLDWASAGGFPCKPITAFGDFVTSNILLNGVMVALFAQRQTGKGSLVSTSLYGAGVWHNACGILAAQPCFGSVFPKSRFEPMNPFSHFYECKDGQWLNITVMTYDASREKVFRLLGMDEYQDDPRFTTIARAKENIVAIVEIMNEKFKMKTRDEWVALFQENDLVHEKLLHFADVAQDPQAIANGYLEDVRYTTGTEVKMPQYPLVFSEFGTKPTVPSPGVGHDTAVVLRELGYSAREIERMRQEKAVL